MIYIITSIFTFILTIVLHIILSNIIPRFLAKMRNTLLVYVLGFFINAFFIYFLQNLFINSDIFNSGSKINYNVNNLLFLPLLVTANIIYILLSLAYLLFFLSPFMGDESPSSKIFLLLRRGDLSDRQIVSNFSNQKLIEQRLEDMIDVGWLRKSGNIYVCTSYGRVISGMIRFYRKILSWDFYG